MTNDFSWQELSTCLGQLMVFPTFFAFHDIQLTCVWQSHGTHRGTTDWSSDRTVSKFR